MSVRTVFSNSVYPFLFWFSLADVRAYSCKEEILRIYHIPYEPHSDIGWQKLMIYVTVSKSVTDGRTAVMCGEKVLRIATAPHGSKRSIQTNPYLILRLQ